ncbi:hypothetical protein BST97_00430 [Nonlabens spongiae]|uniref:Rod shape-determining protein MreD n=1 Tax=Nonlabens spongiae TaxID=331648 RepID=A0A1W6MG90_9FLAO|nr:hypothetical protein BST97_00430 [Nonlabens spongiae]
MNKSWYHTIARFFILLLVQIFVLDQIHFFGFISPMVYFLFVLLVPIRIKLAPYLLLAFFYGWILDTFNDTGGAHAAACLTLAFSRDLLLGLVYGESYKLQNLKITRSPLNRIILLLILSILIHHLVYYFLVIFNIFQIITTLKMVFLVGVASFIISLGILMLIKPKKRS